SVIGQSCNQAKATLHAEGLTGRCENTQSSIANIQKVVGTDPSVGSSVSSGSTVVLKVGVGPSAVTVPQVKGLSQGAATTLLQSKGFKVGSPQILNSPAAAQNVVFGSTPKEGTSQKLGTVVTLKVASGSVVVSDVRGQSCQAATKALEKLTLKATCQNRNNQSPKGEAYATAPYPIGTTAPQKSPITIYISNGPAQVPLPNVVGENVGQAKHALTTAGFRYQVTQVPECNDQSKNNIVTAQTPNGPTAPRDTLVTLTVSKYRPSDPSCGGPPPST
ncbi:MAG TPA: PASTA domain-containing protein, partial [Gaiellales bacterium]|nr:PASTA domain-containing protein [Gaiellales bacterium]